MKDVLAARQPGHLLRPVVYGPCQVGFRLALADSPACDDWLNWEGRGREPLELMTAVLDYLLAN